MNSQKFIVGGIVGGVLFFVLGYIAHGLLFKNFFDNNGMAVNMDAVVWWAMIVGNLSAGFLLSYILGKANVSTAGEGGSTGFIVGLLMSLNFSLIMYGIGHGATTLKAVAAGVAITAIISAVAGAGIGWVLGMSKKTAVAA